MDNIKPSTSLKSIYNFKKIDNFSFNFLQYSTFL
jgi:hypothetical protein